MSDVQKIIYYFKRGVLAILKIILLTSFRAIILLYRQRDTLSIYINSEE